MTEFDDKSLKAHKSIIVITISILSICVLFVNKLVTNESMPVYKFIAPINTEPQISSTIKPVKIVAKGNAVSANRYCGKTYKGIQSDCIFMTRNIDNPLFYQVQ